MYDKEEILRLYEEESNKSEVARAYCKSRGIEYSDSIRKSISNIINDSDEDLQNTTKTETVSYNKEVSSMPSAWSVEKNRFYTVEEYCNVYGLDYSQVKSAKLVSHNASHMVYNIAFFTDEETVILDIDKHLEEVIQNLIRPVDIMTNTDSPVYEDYFDRLVYTDTHIAMNVNGMDGDPLYEGKWDKEEVLNRLVTMVEHIRKFKKSRTLVIDDLGDFMDGLGGQTTRKGHELPQNMNDKEAFDLALLFKTSLVDSLINDYDSIICNDITNDNHSGVFSYFVSSAVKQILEQRYPGKVVVNSIKRFMHHYSIGKHTFIISHGKDSGENKFGLKPKLDTVQAEKIDQYCKENKLYNGNFIEFSKGDSHQALYDDTTSNDFQYYNYPAFSPPSNWVKTNFKNSKSGFRLYNISKDENIKIAIPYWFDNR